MRIDLLSLFPEYFESPLRASILGRAQKAGIVQVHAHQLRDYSTDHHHRVDDRALGGGPGQVLMVQPLDRALKELASEKSRIIYLSPAGRPFNRGDAARLSKEPHIIFICGHYEGIDQRIIDTWVDEEISIGDFVLTNGCLAALAVLDATVRFIPGVLGDEASRDQDSFEKPLLDHPHYTLPRSYEGLDVPPVLVTGDHARIEKWRSSQALELTWRQRPDLASMWLNEDRTLPSQRDGLQGIILKTQRLQFYRKWLYKELGLPWIDKSATMGALLLTQGEILLWQSPDDMGNSQVAGTQIVLSCLDERHLKRALCSLNKDGPVKVTSDALGITFEDPSGWRLHLQKEQKKQI